MTKKFLTFLREANSIGAGFEQKTAEMVQKWLCKNGMAGEFSAKRYQTVEESDKNRDENFSDVIVEDSRGDSFFIECKEFDRSNVVNVQFDITENGDIVPVKGYDRSRLTEAESGRMEKLTSALRECDGLKAFLRFLNCENDWLDGKNPANYYFGNATDVDKMLTGLVRAYNKAVSSGEVEADCKPFKMSNIREATKQMLVVALAWRLSDPSRTWDICQVRDLPFFGDIIRRRYSMDKEIPVRYIQFGDKLFRIDADNDPFAIGDVPVFPAELRGNYTLKFTPRFGTGSVYVTPRSEITSEFDSPYSFVDTKKWPDPLKGELSAGLKT